jgi:hypothetical protein
VTARYDAPVMAEPLKLHPNKPEPIHFPCPSCGRDCRLTPVFHTEGAARGVRHGNNVQHSLPVCRTYDTMSAIDFMKLATYEVPVLRDDPHVSVKIPEPPPLIISDGLRAPIVARTPEERFQLEAERHQRDIAAFRAEGIELGRVRDQLRSEEPTVPPPRRMRRRLGVAVGLGVLIVVLLLVVVVLRLR